MSFEKPTMEEIIKRGEESEATNMAGETLENIEETHFRYASAQKALLIEKLVASGMTLERAKEEVGRQEREISARQIENRKDTAA